MITQFHILSRMTCKDPQSDGWVKLELSKQLPGLSSNKHYFWSMFRVELIQSEKSYVPYFFF